MAKHDKSEKRQQMASHDMSDEKKSQALQEALDDIEKRHDRGRLMTAYVKRFTPMRNAFS